jgi:hypothetical protein
MRLELFFKLISLGLFLGISLFLCYILFILIRNKIYIKNFKYYDLIIPSGLIRQNNIINYSDDIENNALIDPEEILANNALIDPTDIFDFHNNDDVDLTLDLFDLIESSSDTSGGTVFDIQSISDSDSSVDYDTDASDLSVETWEVTDHIIQGWKMQEINDVYSNEMIQYAITQAELRDIIELFPIIDLYTGDINNLILIIMSYYHC